ncbi:sensor histidine kinase [Thermomonas sp.]|uniref:sensor histidine kinase n=1 Tax=Thermomonas sp. TaxID=1971895 RepID=UPI002F09E136
MRSTEPRGWSLRTRLVWQLVLAIGLLLGGLFLVLDVLVDRAMYRQLDQFLAARTGALVRQLGAEAHSLDEVLPAWDIAGHTDFFAIYDARGRLQAASMNSGDRPLRAPAGVQGDILLPDGHAGRYRVETLASGGFVGSRLVVATERESWDRTERRMHGVLLAGTLAAVIAAVLLCLLLVRQAFVHMAREARRLPHDGPPEPGSLATTPRELHPFVEAAHAALRTSWGLAERERRLSRSVAHELRTPVAEIAAVTELARRDGDPAALQRALATVAEANGRMQRGIEALLALARFESGQEPPQADPLDLAALLRALVAGGGEELDPARLAAQLPDEAWGVCDAGMLERIAANLLRNAVEYGDPGTPVEVALSADGAGWWLRVRNRASGLTEADVARFGERHWRGDRAADARHAGLGLALVQAMAAALGLALDFTLRDGVLEAALGPIPAL